MDRTRIVGGALCGLGIVGYVAGIAVPYTGRAFSITALMVGVTLYAVGGSE
ncbi:MAG: hypothetical protein ABEJ74_08665 [Haloferacaceae archaeon]